MWGVSDLLAVVDTSRVYFVKIIYLKETALSNWYQRAKLIEIHLRPHRDTENINKNWQVINQSSVQRNTMLWNTANDDLLLARSYDTGASIFILQIHMYGLYVAIRLPILKLKKRVDFIDCQ